MSRLAQLRDLLIELEACRPRRYGPRCDLRERAILVGGPGCDGTVENARDRIRQLLGAEERRLMRALTVEARP